MFSKQTKKWIFGTLMTWTGLKNMYKYGASITAAIKLGLAHIGLYGNVVSENGLSPEALEAYFEVFIGVILPPYLAMDGSFVGFLDFIFTTLSIVFIGTFIAAAKYETNTPMKRRRTGL